MGLLEFLWMTRVRKQLTIHRPLNYLDYNKEHARGGTLPAVWLADYGGKHSESRFTKFYQDIFSCQENLVSINGLHLSSLIVSGQITRQAALAELAEPVASPDQPDGKAGS